MGAGRGYGATVLARRPSVSGVMGGDFRMVVGGLPRCVQRLRCQRQESRHRLGRSVGEFGVSGIAEMALRVRRCRGVG